VAGVLYLNRNLGTPEFSSASLTPALPGSLFVEQRYLSHFPWTQLLRCCPHLPVLGP